MSFLVLGERKLLNTVLTGVGHASQNKFMFNNNNQKTNKHSAFCTVNVFYSDLGETWLLLGSISTADGLMLSNKTKNLN